ncbi:hypothetical protein D3C72_1177980 [compost metagenome]
MNRKMPAVKGLTTAATAISSRGVTAAAMRAGPKRETWPSSASTPSTVAVMVSASDRRPEKAPFSTLRRRSPLTARAARAAVTLATWVRPPRASKEATASAAPGRAWLNPCGRAPTARPRPAANPTAGTASAITSPLARAMIRLRGASAVFSHWAGVGAGAASALIGWAVIVSPAPSARTDIDQREGALGESSL